MRNLSLNLCMEPGVWEPQRQYFGTLLEKHRTNDSSKKILHDVSGFQKTEYTPS